MNYAIIISLLALFFSFYQYRINYINNLNHTLFNDLLLKELPYWFNFFLQHTEEEKSGENFLKKLDELSDIISFYQFFNQDMFKVLKKLVLEIEENFTKMNNLDSSLSKYTSYAVNDMKKIYNILYSPGFIFIIKSSISNMYKLNKKV